MVEAAEAEVELVAMAAAAEEVELVAMVAVEDVLPRAAAGSASRLPPRELPAVEVPAELLEGELLEVEVPPRWTGSCRRRRSRASTHGCRTRCGSYEALT